MNGLLDAQTSSNNWGLLAQSMLHEHFQVDTSKRVAWTCDHSMFSDRDPQIPFDKTDFQDTLDTLKRRFIFGNTEAVEDFLKAHRGVVPVLLEAAPYMAKAFGEETPLTLEIMPEDGLPRTIYALAMWSGERTQSREALNSFDELWLIRNLKKAAGRIVFDYELI
ncbi:MAG TPA: hypothetical protein VFE22_03620 [Edaphobacter sp.]|nr:hypothetical protein [Edaphobacter sp.]